RMARRWPARDPRRRWSWSRRFSTNAGRSRSRLRLLFLSLGAPARFDVLLQRLHVRAYARGVLRSEPAPSEAQQAGQLVVHLIDQPGRAVLVLRVGVGPGSF